MTEAHNTTETNTLNLLNAELDGELAGADRLVLDELLAKDPGARALQRELRALEALLAAVGEVEPPAGLREEIIGCLPTPVIPASAPAPTAKIYRLAARALKPALSMAAALVVAIALLQLVPGQFDAREMALSTGAMVNVPAGSLAIEQPGLSASVNITPSEAGMLVDVSIDSSKTTATLIEVLNNRFTLKPGSMGRIENAELEANDYSIQISSSGKFEAQAILEPGAAQPQPQPGGEDTIRVQFVQEDRIIHESILRLPERERR